MNVIDAAHATVHNSKHGGSPALAARMGMSSNVLNSKVNPNCETHHLRLDEALTIMEFTGDHCIIQAMAQQLGGAFTVINASTSVEDLVMSMLKIGGQGGGLLGIFQAAIEDGHIDRNEYKAIKALLQKQVEDLQAMSHALDKHCGISEGFDNPKASGGWRA
ncbi:phage regulatory CII family protein [Psychrobacter arenosus]|uniref:phage regulatory CII family protein n=1 Tax=Psychrobacter arenosus TaxID=256326 RepID=UPI00191A0E5B|nr:phage regulatory CII family protein [Psychrobacter arenosus]